MSRKPKASDLPTPAPVGSDRADQGPACLSSAGEGLGGTTVRKGGARRLARPYGFVDETGTAWHWRSGQVVTGDVLIALEARGAPLGPLESERSIMQVKPSGRFGEDR